MRILVTGATGFLGSRLVAHLACAHEVWGVARRDQPPNLMQVRWLRQDLAHDIWDMPLPEQMDAVVHLAQSPHFRNFPESARDIFAVSAGATMRLLDWSRRAGARYFILASTGGLYGSSDVPVRETDALPEVQSQLGFYFAAKRASELIAAQFASVINVVTLRYFFVYGAGQAPQMLMPRLLASIRNGQPVYLHGEEGIRINPIHVDDAVMSIERSLELSESQLINIAGSRTVSLRDIALMISSHVGRAPVFAVDTAGRPNHLMADIQQMTHMLGAPTIDIEAGIAGLCRGEV